MEALGSLAKLFAYYRRLGEQAIAQVSDGDLARTLEPDGNSISLIAKHMAGNLRSRFTEFLESDGEKPWRDREGEFRGPHADRSALLADWERGWACLESALAALGPDDLERIVHIRNEGHTVIEALQRQLAHHAYHVGQIVLIARTFAGPRWCSLSIPRGGSAAFNAAKFAEPPGRRHFADGSSRDSR